MQCTERLPFDVNLASLCSEPCRPALRTAFIRVLGVAESRCPGTHGGWTRGLVPGLWAAASGAIGENEEARTRSLSAWVVLLMVLAT